MRLKGHRLVKLQCYDTVSHKYDCECRCGWKYIVGSQYRGRQAYQEHLLAEAKRLQESK